MAKYLYLFRHSQSEQKQSGQHDRTRELTTIGVKESLLMGGELLRQQLKFDVIYASPAIRAVTSASLLADALKIDPDHVLTDDELYEASVRTFLEFINRMDDHYHNVMCVGHNPTITYLAEYLTKAEIGDLPTAGLVSIKFTIDSWKQVAQGNGELVQYLYPAILPSYNQNH